MSDTKMKAEELIDEMYMVLDRAWTLPLSRGRTVVDGDEIRQILDELRESLPNEIHEAQKITADRNQILAGAKRESESIIRLAEERKEALINHEAVVQQAEKRANELMALAQKKSREIRKAGNDYLEDLMRRADESLSANLAELRRTRQNIRNAERQTGKRKRQK
jgi:gas vesicle protein